MNTNELINALSIDAVKPPAPGRAFAAALIAGIAVAAGLFLALLGLRPNLLQMLGEPRCLFKIVLMAFLAASSAIFLMRLSRPGASLHGSLLLLAATPALLALALGAEMMVTSPADWHARMMGANAMFCLKSIPMLGLAPLIAVLIALRYGAPDNPALAGAAAGLFAGAVGAALYAMHCPDDSPFFVTLWYSVGIAALAALGATLGARLLRW